MVSLARTPPPPPPGPLSPKAPHRKALRPPKRPSSGLPDDLSIEPLAFALPRGDSSYRMEVNRALTQVYVGGQIESIFNQWLGALGQPSGLLGAMYLLNAIPK